jgi:acid phosphatase family membrane protein YuiD
VDWLSPYLIAIVTTWILAHLIKYILDVLTRPPRSKAEKVFRSGGMPSAHAATSTALWMVILVKDGWGSGLFALATLFLLIVTHDAVRVRRASGEQGEAIGLLIDETKSKIPHPRAPKGHTPAEVGAGWLLGLVVGALVVWIF